jgi:hypothetical protein
MSRKHYRAIAEALAAVAMPDASRAELVRVLSDLFKSDNPNFNRQIFATACGIDPRGPDPDAERKAAQRARRATASSLQVA